MPPMNSSVSAFDSKVLHSHTNYYCRVLRKKVMLLTQMLLSGAQKKTSKLRFLRYFVLIFCPVLSIIEPTRFVRLSNIRVTTVPWQWALETAVKIILVGGRILLGIELVHLLKTSILGSHLLLCYSPLEPWEAPAALVFPGSFLSLEVPEAVPASLPPGHALLTQAYMQPQDLALGVFCEDQVNPFYKWIRKFENEAQHTWVGEDIYLLCVTQSQTLYSRTSPFCYLAVSFITTSHLSDFVAF